MRLPEYKAQKERAELKRTSVLLESEAGPDRAELAWRTAVPVMALVLMVLAMPLARLRPRQGRFARIGLRDPRLLPVLEPAGRRARLDREGHRRGPAWPVVGALAPACIRLWLLWRDERPGRSAATSPAAGAWATRMTTLGNYIVRTVLGYTALVMLVLIALGALFLFIGQQDDIGTGSYTVIAGR